MSHLQKAATLTQQMIERRDFLRKIYGDRYEHEVQQFRQVLRGLTAEKGVPLVTCALNLSKEMSGAGHDPSMVIAAFVEECEADK